MTGELSPRDPDDCDICYECGDDIGPYEGLCWDCLVLIAETETR